MNPEIKKFTEGEILIGSLFFLGIDGLCFLLDLTAIGALPAAVIQFFANFLMIQIWFKSKGVETGKFGKQLIRYAGGELPSGNFLVFIVSAVAHNKAGGKSVPALAKLA